MQRALGSHRRYSYRIRIQKSSSRRSHYQLWLGAVLPGSPSTQRASANEKHLNNSKIVREEKSGWPSGQRCQLASVGTRVRTRPPDVQTYFGGIKSRTIHCLSF